MNYLPFKSLHFHEDTQFKREKVGKEWRTDVTTGGQVDDHAA